MNNRNSTIWVVLELLFILFVLHAFCQSMVIADEWDDRRNYTRSKDISLSFYGKVVDQNLKPVKDVAVTLQFFQFDLTVKHFFTGVKSIVVHTDAEGLFSLEHETGHNLMVAKVAKDGYEYIYREIAFERIKPDKNQPVIFNVRKKEKPEFIIPGEFRFRFDSTDANREIDLVKIVFAKPGVLGTRTWAKDEHADIRIKAVLDGANRFVVTFSTPDSGAGINASNQLLYVAPDGGYVPSQTLTIDIPDNLKMRFYLKGRQGNIYSRLDVKVRATKEKLGMTIDSWTNPNGSRNIDYDEKIYSHESLRRYEEDRRQAIEREKKKLLNPDPLQCCIYSWDHEKYGPLNCGLPTDNRCPKGTTGHPWACEKLDWCR